MPALEIILVNMPPDGRFTREESESREPMGMFPFRHQLRELHHQRPAGTRTVRRENPLVVVHEEQIGQRMVSDAEAHIGVELLRCFVVPRQRISNMGSSGKRVGWHTAT
jgi:hypothetical protein